MMPTLIDRPSKLLLRLAVLNLALIAPGWAQRVGAEEPPAAARPELPTGLQRVGPDGAVDATIVQALVERGVNEPPGPMLRGEQRVLIRPLRFDLDARNDVLLRELPAEPVIPLPPDAQKVFDQYQKDQEAARQKYEQQATQANLALVKQLEEMQARYVQAGKMEDALAVRQQIQILQARAAQAVAVVQAANIPNFSAFRGQTGRTFTFEVTGSVNGSLWGSDIYTDDSSPAVAAVHAGIVHPGQKAMVKVTLMDGLPAFTGSTANGVTSQNYGPWQGAYKIERAADAKPDAAKPAINPPAGDAPPADPAQPGEKGNAAPDKPLADPGALRHYGDFIGRSYHFEVTGSLEGKIWGAGVYTEDSPLATAAVHAGALQPGEKGIVHVTILQPAEKYEGATQNGVTSLAYGKMGESAYRIDIPQNSPAALRQQAFQRATVAQLRELIPGPHDQGSSFELEIIGAMEGTVWGDSIYTDDSNLAAAAVNAGVIGEGERGRVKVTLLPGQEAYAGGTRNGVTTQNFGRWQASFKVERAAKPAH